MNNTAYRLKNYINAIENKQIFLHGLDQEDLTLVLSLQDPGPPRKNQEENVHRWPAANKIPNDRLPEMESDLY